MLELKLNRIASLFTLIVIIILFVCCQEPEVPSEGLILTPKVVFEKRIPELLDKWEIAGCAIALVRGERLILAEGYGLADKENSLPMKPEFLCRIGSVAKPITAVATLKLYEDGLLDLDEKVFEILADLEPPEGATVDPRIYDITIRDLLQHSAGWGRRFYITPEDPMFQSRQIAYAMGVPPPADAETIIRYMMGQQLDWDPGIKHAYSNFGYNVLGRVIERITGQSYEDSVKTHILNPIGITRMQIGRTLESGRAEGEVRYYDYPNALLVQSVFPSGQMVPRPYGGYYLEAMDAHGGWIASAIDLARFLTAVDGRDSRPDILSPSTLELMLSKPDLVNWENGGDRHYGMGWYFIPEGEEAQFYHTGGVYGGMGFVNCSLTWKGGLAWAVVFNGWPSDLEGWGEDYNDAIYGGLRNIQEWPSHDLFDDY